MFVAIAIGYGRELITSSSENQFDSGGLTWILPLLGIVVVLAAVAGFVAWYFTRFVIDDEELRIETGAIFKKSTKIPFERLQSVDIIQPLAARMFGLAELRLDAGTAPRNCATYAAPRRLGCVTTYSPAPTVSKPAFAILIKSRPRASSPISGSEISHSSK